MTLDSHPPEFDEDAPLGEQIDETMRRRKAALPPPTPERIIRTEIVTREVEIPEGNVVCRFCKGKGQTSKYDEGWRSLIHDPELAALKPCWGCDGIGFVPKDYYLA